MLQIGSASNSQLQARVPYWDQAPYNDMDLVLDAQKGGFRRNSNWGNALSGLAGDVHTAAINMVDTGGNYTLIPPNTLLQNELGVHVVPSRTNLVTNSSFGDLSVGQSVGSATSWQVTGNGGLTVVCVAKGSSFGLNYSDIRVSGTTTSGGPLRISPMASYTAASPGQIYTSSFWIEIIAAATALPTFRTRIYETPSGSTNDATYAYSGTGRYRLERTFTLPSVDTTGAKFDMVFGTGSSGVAYDFTFRVWAPQFELASFASPPILTTGGTSLVGGNRPLIMNIGDLTTYGIAGFVQAEVNQPALSFSSVASRLLEFNDGASSNRMMLLGIESGSGINIQVTTNGTGTGSRTNNGEWVNNSIMTVAFIFSPTLLALQKVGGSYGQVVPSNLPVVNRVGLLGQGLGSTGNTFGKIKKLALQAVAQGANPSTVFSNMLSKAQLAATL